MKMKLILTFVILFILNISVYSQRYQVGGILNQIWELENEKFEGYKTYLFYKNNLIFRFELKNEKLFHSDSYFICKYQFLSDSILDLFGHEVIDKEIVYFFNKKESKNFLLNDSFVDFAKEIKYVNAVHLYESNGVITNAHIWVYQFYNKNSFSQHGIGETSGQPQTGYIYHLAKNVPKEVMREIQKINPVKFYTIETNKSQIYETPQLKAKMYLIKGDIVECLERKKNWLKIRYYGKKTVEGWVKRSDVNIP